MKFAASVRRFFGHLLLRVWPSFPEYRAVMRLIWDMAFMHGHLKCAWIMIRLMPRLVAYRRASSPREGISPFVYVMQ